MQPCLGVYCVFLKGKSRILSLFSPCLTSVFMFFLPVKIARYLLIYSMLCLDLLLVADLFGILWPNGCVWTIGENAEV